MAPFRARASSSQPATAPESSCLVHGSELASSGVATRFLCTLHGFVVTLTGGSGGAILGTADGRTGSWSRPKPPNLRPLSPGSARDLGHPCALRILRRPSTLRSADVSDPRGDPP